jgi:hypothetical protein
VTAPHARRGALVRAADVKMEPIEWLWLNRLPLGMVSLLFGDEGLGKSTLLANLGAAVTRGELDGDVAGPADVIYLLGEDDWQRVAKPRLVAAGADLDRAHFFEVRRGDELTPIELPGDLAELRRAAFDLRPRFIAIDPVADFLLGTNTNRESAVRAALTPLAQLAHDLACAVVIVRHVSKGESSDPLMRQMGSRAFTQLVRSACVFGRDPASDGDDGRVLAWAKSNYAARASAIAFRIEPATLDGGIKTSRLVAVGESEARAEELFAPRRASRSAQLDAAADFLRDQLGDGAWHPTADVCEVAKEEGIAHRTLQRAAGQLGVESARQGFPARGSWRLPVAPAADDATGASAKRRDCESADTAALPTDAEPQSRHAHGDGATEAGEAPGHG